MRINNKVYLVGSGHMGFDISANCDCNVYLLDAGTELVLIDAGSGIETSAIVEQIKQDGLNPKDIGTVLLTHIHADHAGGAADFHDLTGAKIYVMNSAARCIETGDEHLSDLAIAREAGFYPSEYRLRSCPVSHSIADGETFRIGRLEVQALYTRGHSQFDISYLIRDPSGRLMLFCGDTVFPHGKISMLSLPGFSLQSLKESINRLVKLKIDMLFPGHYHFTLRNAHEHIDSAMRAFDVLTVPNSIV